MPDNRSFTTDTAAITVTATAGGASANVIYTCPPYHDATIDFLHVSNGATAVHNITLQWYHADTNTYHHILNDKSVAGKDVYNVITSDRIHLHAGDSISAFDGASGNLEVFISVRQFYNAARKQPT
jgi:hypothetical protein